MTYQDDVVRLSDIIIPKYYGTFNDTSYMHKIFSSGRAGTKSSRGAIKAVEKIVEDDNCSVVILRKFHNKLKKTVYKEVLRAIKRLHLDKTDFKITVSPMEVKYLPNGNTIYFTGNDSIDDTKGMIDEEKPIKLVIVDELTEFFEKGEGEDELVNIVATFVRGNDDEFCIEYYFNPPRNDKSPIMEWTHKMELRPDCIRVHTDYRDVPQHWLGQKLIAEAEAMKLLKLVGLANKAHALPGELSGGQQQRVSIARALANDPTFLLCDEPTGNLDSKMSTQIMEILSDLHKQGRTLVMVTHNPETAEYADRVIVIRDGEIVAEE